MHIWTYFCLKTTNCAGRHVWYWLWDGNGRCEKILECQLLMYFGVALRQAVDGNQRERGREHILLRPVETPATCPPGKVMRAASLQGVDWSPDIWRKIASSNHPDNPPPAPPPVTHTILLAYMFFLRLKWQYLLQVTNNITFPLEVAQIALVVLQLAGIISC